MANTDDRQTTIDYLTQMADEMKKMAQTACVPSLALLFEMAVDEGLSFLKENSAQTRNSSARPVDRKRSVLTVINARSSEKGAKRPLAGRRRHTKTGRFTAAKSKPCRHYDEQGVP